MKLLDDGHEFLCLRGVHARGLGLHRGEEPPVLVHVVVEERVIEACVGRESNTAHLAIQDSEFFFERRDDALDVAGPGPAARDAPARTPAGIK